MRIVATSDTHHKVDVKFVPDADVFLHCGDIMQNGYESEWKDCLDWLNELPHKLKIITFGNHDFHPFLYPGPALQDLRKIGVTVLGYPGNTRHYKITLPNNMTVGACPYVQNLPRWAFNEDDSSKIDEHLDQIGYVDIMMTHSPIYGVMDRIHSKNYGVYSFQTYVKNYRPKYWVQGHLHERYGSYFDDDSTLPLFHNQNGRTGCKIYNVAMCDTNQNHVNPPVVLDF